MRHPRSAACPLLLVALGLGACTGPKFTGLDPVTTTSDSAEDTADDTGAPVTPTAWSIGAVTTGRITELAEVAEAITNPLNGWTYLRSGRGDMVRTLTNAYIAPEGDWCVNGTGEECRGGVLMSSGRITPVGTLTHLCLDEVEGDLFMVQEGRGRVEIADVGPEGLSAMTYNRVDDVLNLPAAVLEDGAFDGPCAALPGSRELLLSAPGAGTLMRIGVVTEEIGAVADIGVAPKKIAVLPGEDQLVYDDAEGGLLLVASVADLSVQRAVKFGAPIADWAVDPKTGMVWVALGAAGAARVDLSDDSGLAIPLEMKGNIRLVTADQRDGLAWFAGATSAGEPFLSLAGPAGALDSVSLAADAVALAPPTDLGDLAVFLETGGGQVNFAVYETVPDPLPDLPPLRAYLITTIEEPFDDEIDKPCTGDSADSFERQIDIILGNAAVVASLELPTALAITYNFAEVAERCERTDIFQTLTDMGFELGVMVHNKPGYNCLTYAVDGVDADLCAPTSPFACDPARLGSCTLPGDEDYCGYGDYDCYKSYMDEKNVVIDRNIPGGGAFVLGADRHGLWGWDWVRAYQELARADGTSGFDISMFAHLWAYTDQVVYEDERSKNPAPWYARDGVTAWAPVSQAQWDRDSAFSDLLYLPGFNAATMKLGEWHRSGLFMLSFNDSGATYTYNPDDFTILTQYLRTALHYRSEFEPNVWYFHVHDLSLVHLADATGAEQPGAAMLRSWVSSVKETYGDQILWQLPSEIGAEFPPR